MKASTRNHIRKVKRSKAALRKQKRAWMDFILRGTLCEPWSAVVQFPPAPNDSGITMVKPDAMTIDRLRRAEAGARVMRIEELEEFAAEPVPYADVAAELAVSRLQHEMAMRMPTAADRELDSIPHDLDPDLGSFPSLHPQGDGLAWLIAGLIIALLLAAAFSALLPR